MSEVFHRQSAKIYDFPPRGRFALLDRLNESKLATDTLRVANGILSSGSWYHDAAIQESDRARNNNGSPSRKP